jgi:hypothetical protein
MDDGVIVRGVAMVASCFLFCGSGGWRWSARARELMGTIWREKSDVSSLCKKCFSIKGGVSFRIGVKLRRANVSDHITG